MTIDTDYRIGDKIWVVYEYQKEVQVYSDTIESILVSKGNGKEKVSFWLKDSDYDELTEDAMVPYEDSEGLYEKIIEVETKIKEKEANGEY